MEVDVVIRRGDRAVDTVKRPLRIIDGVQAVRYRGRLWTLDDGAIDVLGVPLSEPARPARDKRKKAAMHSTGRDSVPSQDVSSSGWELGESPGVAGAVPSHSAASDLGPDKDQLRVIAAPANARMLVQAGPGSGKTEVTARRIAHLLSNGLSPSQVLVLSFSRSAVRNLTQRLNMVADGFDDAENLRHVGIRTFDSLAFRLLRIYGEPPGKLLKRPHEINIKALFELTVGPHRDDIIKPLGEKLHIFVDEFQDLTGYRALLVRELLTALAPPESKTCGFTLLGDPAQAIYGFVSRSSETPPPNDVWEDIRSTYAKGITALTLQQNHRATPEVADFAAGLRAILEGDLSPEEKLKEVFSAIHKLPAPEEKDISPKWAARPYKTSAVLTRTNGEAVSIWRKLQTWDVDPPANPIVLKAGAKQLSAPAWVGGLLSPVRSSSVPRSQFVQIYKHVVKTFGPEALEALKLPELDRAWATLLRAAGQPEEDAYLNITDLRGRLTWPEAFTSGELRPELGLLISTIHQSKGLEFQEVHLLETDPESFPEDYSAAEEAAIGFVGVTRASQKIGRISPVQPMLGKKYFSRGGSRVCSWHFGRVILEIGIPGDISPLSFASTTLHGSAQAVITLHEYMIKHADSLRGRKVVLCKVSADDHRSLYDIHLQDATNEPGLLIGRTTEQLTSVLFELLWDRGYSLPSRIWNLRIGELSTVTAIEESLEDIPHLWSTSRLWMGIDLVGTGDFKPYKRAGGGKS